MFLETLYVGMDLEEDSSPLGLFLVCRGLKAPVCRRSALPAAMGMGGARSQAPIGQEAAAWDSYEDVLGRPADTSRPPGVPA